MSSKPFDLTDRVVMITGAGRGLGRALSHGLAAQGALIAAGDIDANTVRDTVTAVGEAGGLAIWQRVDVTDAGSCAAFVRDTVMRLGRIDVLVNNAGIDIVEPIGAISQQGWQKVVDVDLAGVLQMSQAAVKHMRDRAAGGSIINISSIAAFAGIHGLGSYSAAKSGVNQLTRVMAVELAPDKIRVNAIAPGYLENIMQGLTAVHADPEMERRIRQRTPLGRRARLDELIGPVAFLASDAASYVTGAILMVDGGYTAA